MSNKIFRYFTSSANYNKFCILGHARTGSNFLLAGLKNSSQVKVHHEIFAGHNRAIGRNFDKIYHDCFSSYHYKIRSVGFKLFYYHLTDEEKNKLFLIDDIRYIHLMRKNKLETLVSLDLAFKTGLWSTDQKKDTSPTIFLETKSLIDRISTIENYEVEFQNRITAKKNISIYYEDLVLKKEIVFNKIFEFIGIQNIPDLEINLKKQKNDRLENTIENYNEVYNVLKESQYYGFLNMA